MTVTTGSEREVLEAWLDFHRDVVVRKVADLDLAAAAARHVPSETTLAGLLRHLVKAEREWFQEVLLGIPPLPGQGPHDADTSWHIRDEDTIPALVEAYQQECARSRAVAAEVELDAVVPFPLAGGEVSLRWIYVHMIEETARHAGHADILRELTDGATGVA
jgi:uncharacterized damage-inducible protein DinB